MTKAREEAERLVQDWMRHLRDDALKSANEIKLFKRKETDPLRYYAEKALEAAEKRGVVKGLRLAATMESPFDALNVAYKLEKE